MTTKLPLQQKIQIDSLERLPYDVYFVTKSIDKFHELIGHNSLPDDLLPYYEKCIDGVDIWSVQTYIHLKQRGLNVHLVSYPIPGNICIIPYHHLSIRDTPFNSYVVGCRLDSARPEICEQQTVLNPLNVLQPTDHFLPHWSQPTLQPRDPARGTTLETLDFKGGALNLAKPFNDAAFHQELQKLGITFVMASAQAQTHSINQYRLWGDYTQSDAILAIRNLTEADFLVKPAVKLINAWHAGCPALLGAEPAYRALRRSELDYIEVHSPKDVIEALRQLKDNQALYSAMVENGFERAQEVSTDCIAALWRELLAGSIATGYEQWKRQSPLQKLVGRPLKFTQRVIRHKQQLKQYLYDRDCGSRVFGNEP